MTLIAAVTSAMQAGKSRVTVEVSGLLDAFINGDYTHVRVYEGQWPDPGTDTLLAETTIDSVVINSPTNITIVCTDPTPEILVTSLAAEHKYGVYQGAGQPNVYFSIGEVTEPWNPDFVVGSADFFATDHIDFDGTLEVTELEDPITAYDVEVSSTTPESTFTYTSTAQATDGVDPVNKIGRQLTVSVLGSGGGTADPATTITDRTGLSETITNTAGDPGVVENTHVVDEEDNEGTSVDVTPVAPNADIAIAYVDSYLDISGAALTTLPAISIGAGKWMLVRTQGITTKPVTPDATGLSFSLIAEYDGPVSSVNIRYYVAFCESAFSDDVDFTSTAGSTKSGTIMEVTLSTPATLSAVTANTTALESWTGVEASPFNFDYNEEFSNTRNAGVAFNLEYGFVASEPSDAEWTEIVNELDSPIAVADMAINTPPTTQVSWDFAGTPGYVVGLAIELQAVP